ncbi:MAG: butyrate kinase [Candidatus Riflebacteria bacterium]|nr:butyrate kinase [Candidatus Riflebacteria bacterium]
MIEKPLVLVINPGSTSTKIALFKGDEQQKELDITHATQDLAAFHSSLEQLDFRFKAVEEALSAWGYKPTDLQAVIGRGGALKPVSGGVYHAGETLLNDLRNGKLVDHVSVLGGLIANKIADEAGIPAYIADPISTDEFEEVARISGCPELPRVSLVHALNIKAVAAEVASEEGKKIEEVNYIVAHLGGGFSIAPYRQGRLIDVNNANDSGPMSPERAGTLPLQSLLRLCFSGKYQFNELKKMLLGRGGMFAHLGTSDCREVTKRIEAGDEKARLVLEAMAYQIAKEIGAMATVLKGKVDTIILTGGVAHNPYIVKWVTERVSFIAPVKVKPGQKELHALAAHACRALAEPSIVKEY